MQKMIRNFSKLTHLYVHCINLNSIPMKTSIVLLILFLAFRSYAQSSPEEYMATIPVIPSDLCKLSDNDSSKFLDQVYAYSQKLSNEIGELRREARTNAKNKEDQIKTGALRNAGFSETDINKLKNQKTMSEADKMEMANRMMQQRAGITLEEAKKLQSMTKAEKDAWAAQYASRRMAEAQANPGANARMQADQQRSKSMVDLLAEQKELSEKLAAGEQAQLKKFEKMNAEAAQGKKELDQKCKPLQDEWARIPEEGATPAQIARAVKINQEVLEYKKQYCDKYTPLYLQYLSEYRSYVEKILPDVKRQEDIANQMLMTQTGLTEPLSRPGELRLSEIKKYVDLLGDVFKYRLY
jgi:hypothetical protein